MFFYDILLDTEYKKKDILFTDDWEFKFAWFPRFMNYRIIWLKWFFERVIILRPSIHKNLFITKQVGFIEKSNRIPDAGEYYIAQDQIKKLLKRI